MIHDAAIVDTNVVVAGLITSTEEAPTRQILDSMIAGDFRFLLSIALIEEYRSVLLREKLRNIHGLSGDQIDGILEDIAFHGIVRQPDISPNKAPDEGDQHLWDLLEYEPKACLVTGDQQLIEASDHSSIIEPAVFVKVNSNFSSQ